MQRLTKYALLLKAILKKTEDEEQQETLKAMAKKVESFVSHVNSHLRQRQENERLKTIIARIDSYEPVVSFYLQHSVIVFKIGHMQSFNLLRWKVWPCIMDIQQYWMSFIHGQTSHCRRLKLFEWFFVHFAHCGIDKLFCKDKISSAWPSNCWELRDKLSYMHFLIRKLFCLCPVGDQRRGPGKVGSGPLSTGFDVPNARMQWQSSKKPTFRGRPQT